MSRNDTPFDGRDLMARIWWNKKLSLARVSSTGLLPVKSVQKKAKKDARACLLVAVVGLFAGFVCLIVCFEVNREPAGE
jgi:hypothetical protein